MSAGSLGRLVGVASAPSQSLEQSGPSGSQLEFRNLSVQLASGEEKEDEESRSGREIESESESDIQHKERSLNTRNQSKLAGQTRKRDQVSGQQAGGGDERRFDGGPAEQQLTRTVSSASEANQQHQHSSAPASASTPKQPGKKVGLLEALLGERGRNWFEHRTVILDIQNGKQKAADKSKLSTKQSGTLARAESYTKLDEQEQQPDRSHLIASNKVSSEDQERRLKKYSRLPTFGSIPQRLNSLSSATRREVEITRAQQTGSTREKPAAPLKQTSSNSKRANNIGRNSVGSSRLSNLSSSSASSSQLASSAASTSSGHSGLAPRVSPTTAPPARPHAKSAAATRPISRRQSPNQPPVTSPNASTGRRSSSLGFNNISNLFPGEPVRRRQHHQEAPQNAHRSASLVDLSDKRAHLRNRHQFDHLLAATSPLAQSAAEAARQRQRRIAQQHPQGRLASAMMRQGAGQQRAASVQRDSKANNYPSYQQHQQRLRPASATGNYLSGGGARGRSPSASYRLGSAGMSPLVDPDCPVHGDQPGGQRGPNYERDDLFERPRYADYAPARSAAPGYYSSSQPDLMYAPEEDPYNIARPTRDYPIYGAERSPAYAKGSPIYSPLSPIDYDTAPAYGGRAGSRADRRLVSSSGAGQQPGAYYNDSSRFSLYHAAPDGGVRSSLAPTSEQLRRILGYRPQPLAKPVHLHPQWAYTRPFIHLQPAGSGFGRSPSPLLGEDGEPLESDEVLKFAPFNRLQDSQAIRAVDFHPSGEVYAIGSNSRALRICAYPAEHELRHFEPFERDEAAGEQEEAADRARHQAVKSPRVLFKFLQLHRGSIYCVSFNPSGQLLATGSNDQTIHIVKYNSTTHNPDGEEFRLTMHNGTVRDLCFIDDSSGNGTSLLLSAGGGDNKIYVTDCDTITPFQSMAGHTQMVMALNHCGGAQFVSGSYDKTIRFWDLRARSCTSIVSAPPTSALSAGSANLTSGPGAPVCALRVDPSGRLLASGHTDTTCMLYDIRGGKIIQTFRPHDDEIRAISFSPKSYYLLTGGYDGRLVVSDLQGDLTQPLPSVCVAESQDKIVQAKWHPADFTFVSTSADKSATLWSLPGEIRN